MKMIVVLVISVMLKKWLEREKAKMMPELIVRNIEFPSRVNFRARASMDSKVDIGQDASPRLAH